MSVIHEITGGLVHLDGNPIQITLTASAARLNHKLALKVTVTNMVGVEMIGSPYTEEVAPKDLVSVFDISGLVNYPAVFYFDYPPVGAAYDNAVAKLAILQIGEVWTDELGEWQEEFHTPIADHTIRIIKGKLRPYELALLNELNTNFDQVYIQNGKFLTHLPNFQKISPIHIPMLWYLNRWTTSRAISINLKAFTNFKVIQAAQSHTIWDITGLICFTFSPVFWGMALEPGEIVESYEFWINDAEGDAEGGMLDISEHRTFLVDHDYHESSFTFYYTNPLSGIDLIWLTGKHIEGIKTENEIAYQPVPVGSKTKAASLKTVSASSQRNWELNTGFKTRAELLSIRDFLEAKERWMVDPDQTNRLIPVIIESGDFTLYDSDEDINSLTIKILEAHR